jgi:K+-sensing histidine kinase KdpD
LAIWLADNQAVSRRLVVLGFPALVAGAYDWLFVPPFHSLAVETPEGFAAIGLVFAVTATVGALLLRAKR